MEPVWYLPGIATRFEVSEQLLRQALFRETNMMYPELVTRPDLKVFLPPVGGMTVYIWGDPKAIPDEAVELTVRVHDECNGSDVFGSDICTCRPYLTHAIEESIRTAQHGGEKELLRFVRFVLYVPSFLFFLRWFCATWLKNSARWLQLNALTHSLTFTSVMVGLCVNLPFFILPQARGW